MDPRESPSAADLSQRLVESLSASRKRFQLWRDELREDPSALWRAKPLRIALWVTLGLVLVFGVRWATGLLIPATSAEKGEPQIAIVRLTCTNQSCNETYVQKLALDTDRWPQPCARCGQMTAHRAVRCDKCYFWYAASETAPECPRCLAAAAANQPEKPLATRPADPDDAEDGWSP